ncbi:hypothetical protein BV898_10577 [Hypsibius exemplaris]|uniref:Uncharacterized protein n=1 Tax=Hypsibius exemplaris TaxID=2072580 RepID=A0A1W0WJ88_HYPEX|nr:hypothetical protein BV898_10577 [Hypsibius exemplaris]
MSQQRVLSKSSSNRQRTDCRLARRDLSADQKVSQGLRKKLDGLEVAVLDAAQTVSLAKLAEIKRSFQSFTGDKSQLESESQMKRKKSSTIKRESKKSIRNTLADVPRTTDEESLASKFSASDEKSDRQSSRANNETEANRGFAVDNLERKLSTSKECLRASGTISKLVARLSDENAFLSDKNAFLNTEFEKQESKATFAVKARDFTAKRKVTTSLDQLDSESTKTKTDYDEQLKRVISEETALVAPPEESTKQMSSRKSSVKGGWSRMTGADSGLLRNGLQRDNGSSAERPEAVLPSEVSKRSSEKVLKQVFKSPDRSLESWVPSITSEKCTVASKPEPRKTSKSEMSGDLPGCSEATESELLRPDFFESTEERFRKVITEMNSRQGSGETVTKKVTEDEDDVAPSSDDKTAPSSDNKTVVPKEVSISEASQSILTDVVERIVCQLEDSRKDLARVSRKSVKKSQRSSTDAPSVTDSTPLVSK